MRGWTTTYCIVLCRRASEPDPLPASGPIAATNKTPAWITTGAFELASTPIRSGVCLYDPPRTRTWNLLIKSQLLCQIELAGLTENQLYNGSDALSTALPTSHSTRPFRLPCAP